MSVCVHDRTLIFHQFPRHLEITLRMGVMIGDVDAEDCSNWESHFLTTCRFWMELSVLNREGLWIRSDLHRIAWFVFNGSLNI